MFTVIDMPTLAVVGEQRTLFGAVRLANAHVAARPGMTPGGMRERRLGAYVVRPVGQCQEVVWTTWGGDERDD